jgi:hypothetical protein
MQRDILLLTEMIDAAEQAHQLTAGITIILDGPAVISVPGYAELRECSW